VNNVVTNKTKRIRSDKDTLFGRFAQRVSAITGSPAAFIIAVATIVVWGALGPVFGYSDTWQLVINTGTTIITFLMVFVIQHTQNKDTTAMQLKLDELIRANKNAHNVLMDLEDLREDELAKIRLYYIELAEKARDDLRKGKTDTNKPEVKVDFNIGKKKHK